MTRELTPAEIEAARMWVADCVWADMDDDAIAEATPAAITRGVARHYEGGIAQFLRDCELESAA